MSVNDPILLWLGLDLRLTDNPALQAAVRQGRPVIPVFIWSPDEEQPWEPGAASRWWLHQSLTELDGSLRERGSRLIVRRGPTVETIRELLGESGAMSVYWNRRYEPAFIDRERRVTRALLRDGRLAESFKGSLLFEPLDVRTQQGAATGFSRPSGRPVWRSRSPSVPSQRPRTSKDRDAGRQRCIVARARSGASQQLG